MYCNALIVTQSHNLGHRQFANMLNLHSFLRMFWMLGLTTQGNWNTEGLWWFCMDTCRWSVNNENNPNQWPGYFFVVNIFICWLPSRLSCGLEWQWQVGVAGTLLELAQSLVVAEGQFWWSLSRQDGIVGRVEGGKALKLILKAQNTPDRVVMD